LLFIMTTPIEKSEVVHAEDRNSEKYSDKASDSETNEVYTPQEARRLRRRIDARLIPCLGAMYGISLMDRKNVSNAAIAGMTADLDLNVGYRYRSVYAPSSASDLLVSDMLLV
jgi:hypothetical protein